MGEKIARLTVRLARTQVDPYLAKRGEKVVPVAGYLRMYHLAPPSAREAIAAKGLDWREAEVNRSLDYARGNYLWQDRERAEEDLEYQPDFDLYEVDVTDLPLEVDPEAQAEYEAGEAGPPGSFYVADVIPPRRLKRV